MKSFHKSLAIQDQKNTIFDKYVLTCMLNLNGNIIDASKAYLEFIGYTSKEIINTKYNFIDNKYIPKEIIKEIKDALNLGQTFTGEIKNRKKSSQEYWVNTQITPLKDEDGVKIAYLCILSDISYEKRLQEISITDPLTKLYNRGYFDIFIKKELFRCIKEKELFSLILFDMDYFKLYNQLHGNIMGDKVLHRVANALKNNKYVNDKNLFYMSGAEFSIVVTGENSGYLKALVENALESIRLLDIKHENSEISDIVTMSAGVVSINPSIHHISASELLTLADNNLIKAKEKGRNRVVYDVDSIDDTNQEKMKFICTLPNRESLLNDISLLEENSMLILLHLNHINTLKNIYGINGVTNIIAQKSDSLQRLLLDDEVSLYNLNFQEFALLIPRENLHEKYFALMKYSILEDTMVDVDSFENSNASLVTFTAGIAYGKKNILNRADIVLQEAILGKKNYLIYEKTSDTKSSQIKCMDMMKVYKKALIEGGVIPYFQAIVDANSGKVFKYEALARLINDEGEVVSPYYFLGASKEDKTFEAFTKQMMQKVFNVYSKNRINISLNVTYENIMSPSMVSYIKNRLDMYGGEGITFEIVESEEIKDYKILEEFILMIKSYGCKVSIDDFGSGYSNFTNILLLNIDYVKIDGSLVEKLNTDKNVLNIVKALVVFTKGAGMKTIAEFVSSPELVKKVQELGIDYSQGYYYSEPKSALDLGFDFDEI